MKEVTFCLRKITGQSFGILYGGMAYGWVVLEGDGQWLLSLTSNKSNIPKCFDNFPSKHIVTQMSALQWPLGHFCFQTSCNIQSPRKNSFPQAYYMDLFSLRVACAIARLKVLLHIMPYTGHAEKRGLLSPVCWCIKGSCRWSAWIWSNTLWSQWNPFPRPFIQFSLGSLCKS